MKRMVFSLILLAMGMAISGRAYAQAGPPTIKETNPSKVDYITAKEAVKNAQQNFAAVLANAYKAESEAALAPKDLQKAATALDLAEKAATAAEQIFDRMTNMIAVAQRTADKGAVDAAFASRLAAYNTSETMDLYVSRMRRFYENTLAANLSPQVPTGAGVSQGSPSSGSSTTTASSGAAGSEKGTLGGDRDSGGGGSDAAGGAGNAGAVAGAAAGNAGAPSNAGDSGGAPATGGNNGNSGTKVEVGPVTVTTSDGKQTTGGTDERTGGGENVASGDIIHTEAGVGKDAAVARNIQAFKRSSQNRQIAQQAAVVKKGGGFTDPADSGRNLNLSTFARTLGTVVVDHSADPVSAGIVSANAHLAGSTQGGLNQTNVTRGSDEGMGSTALFTEGRETSSGVALDPPAQQQPAATEGAACTCPFGLVTKPQTDSVYECASPERQCISNTDTGATACNDQEIQGANVALSREILIALRPDLPNAVFIPKAGSSLCQLGYHFEAGSVAGAEAYSYTCKADQSPNPCTASGAGLDSCCVVATN